MRTPGPSALTVSPLQRMELFCSRCGYGIVCRESPDRCPMCGTVGAWVEPPRPG
jgi:rubrerythrin